MMLIGVDPGSAQTGLVVIEDGKITGVVLERGSEPLEHFAVSVARTIRGFAYYDDVEICVEDFVTPTAGKGRVSPAALTGSSWISGFLFGAMSQMLDQTYGVCRLVEPAGHGSAPLLAYPKGLIGPSETEGTGWRRHARSAFDIATCHLSMSRLKEVRGWPATVTKQKEQV